MVNLLHLNVIGKGPALILLHGWGWHSGIWSPLIPHLADKFELFIPDLPGFGKSPNLTESYTFENLASSLFKQVPSEAIWLGWSLGGLLAWWVAIHYPEKVLRLITVASSPKFVSDDNWPGIPAATLDKFAQQLISNPEAALTDFLHLQLRGCPQQEVLFTELRSQFSTPHLSALLGGLELLRTTDLRAELHKVTMPSLHLFGNLDTIAPVPGSGLTPIVIPRAGHIPFLTRKEEFLAELFKFLRIP